MTDKIELTREQLKDAFDKAGNVTGEYAFFNRLAIELFGPKKPREWTVKVGGEFIGTEKFNRDLELETIRVREVLDGE